MRDRIIDLLPVLLVSVVLLAFYLLRAQGPGLSFLAPASTPTPMTQSFATTVQRASSPLSACTASRPVFVGNLAMLKSALGSQMGTPVECERVVDADGNTQQRTTAGLAYVRKASNLACFTTGWDHWALVDRRVVFWQGDAVEPPTP